MILQVLFWIYSLFSVDAFTTKVCNMVGKSPPNGLPDAFRAGLLLIMVVNAASAVIAEVLCTLGLRLWAKLQASAWMQRRTSGSDPVLRQGLLRPTHSGLRLNKTPSSSGGLHVPTLQPPSGAALL